MDNLNRIKIVIGTIIIIGLLFVTTKCHAQEKYVKVKIIEESVPVDVVFSEEENDSNWVTDEGELLSVKKGSLMYKAMKSDWQCSDFISIKNPSKLDKRMALYTYVQKLVTENNRVTGPAEYDYMVLYMVKNTLIFTVCTSNDFF